MVETNVLVNQLQTGQVEMPTLVGAVVGQVRSLTTHIPLYFPRVAVVMLILFTLGWCPLSIMSSKILVFLSTHSQSTGGLNFKSHLPVLALLGPLITVAAIKRKSSLQVSAT